MDWLSIAMNLSTINENLSQLCHDLIEELAQYKTVEAEENRLNEIMKESKDDD